MLCAQAAKRTSDVEGKERQENACPGWISGTLWRSFTVANHYTNQTGLGQGFGQRELVVGRKVHKTFGALFMC